MLGLIFTIVLTSIVTFAQDCASVCADTIRLHILANSDEEADQQVKYQVRDAILNQYGFLLSQSQNKEQSLQTLQTLLPKIEETARQVLAEAGFSQEVRATLEKDYFATRQYETFTMPAGEYDALRIVIGKGDGHNWWCVMFPPLCLPAAQKQGVENFSESEQKVLEETPQYEVRFFLVEWLQKLFH